MTVDEARAQGYQVFEGTVRVVSAEELIELQEADIPAAAVSNGGTYAVLVFDEPTDVSGMGADGSGERTESAEMLGIGEYTEYSSFVVEYGDLSLWENLNEQRVTLAAQAQDIMFPSDVRLPIGEPAAHVSVVLS